MVEGVTMTGDAAFPLGDLLRAVRRRADLSQRQLAALAGVAPSLVGRLEAAAALPASYDRLVRLLHAGGCRLAVIDADGDVVPPYRDVRRDQGWRRYPAHLDVRAVVGLGDWWRGFAIQHPRKLPEYTFNLARWRRDWSRELAAMPRQSGQR